MSETAKDGGQAFPVTDQGTHGCYGMSLRDYFAAHAPITVADAMRQLEGQGVKNCTGGQIMKMLVQMRLAYADTMLEERKP